MTIVYDEKYKALAEELRTYLQILGHGKQGVQSNYRSIIEFLSHLETKAITEINKVTIKNIEDYHKYMKKRPNKNKGGHLMPGTISGHMKTVQKLFSMLLTKGKLKSNPASALKFTYPKTTQEKIILTQEEIQQLYKSTISYRERAIISLAYGCGLRVSELVAINIEDIKLRQKIIIVPKGKGNKRRVVPMSKGVVKDLENYFFIERNKLTEGRDYTPQNQAFILHGRGGRMKKYTYNKHLKQIIERIDNEGFANKEISIHNLRHSIATHLLDQGIKLEQVRDFLGHSQLETTEIYTKVYRRQLQKLTK